jgi:hypothetical protein
MRSTLLGSELEKATYAIKRRGKVCHTLVEMQRMGCNTQTLHSNLLILVSFKVKFPGSFTLRVTKFTSSTSTFSKEHTAVVEACVPLRHDP